MFSILPPRDYVDRFEAPAQHAGWLSPSWIFYPLLQFDYQDRLAKKCLPSIGNVVHKKNPGCRRIFVENSPSERGFWVATNIPELHGSVPTPTGQQLHGNVSKTERTLAELYNVLFRGPSKIHIVLADGNGSMKNNLGQQ